MKFDSKGNLIRGSARRAQRDTGGGDGPNDDVVAGLESRHPGIPDHAISAARQMVDPDKCEEFDGLVRGLAEQLRSCRGTD